ncbi:MAG: hypothetical protein IJL73_03275, partial [Lachnospiraceae bacterium]|nr:hypothetical protein [Lachnospiraceae bacterium]
LSFFEENEIEGLEFWILQDVTGMDFSDYILDFAHLGTGGVYFGLGYDIEPNMALDYKEPFVEYTLNQWPDLSDKETHITSIYITDPKVRIYGLGLEDTVEEWQKKLEEKKYTIQKNSNNNNLLFSADSPDETFSINFFAEPLHILIDAPVTNRTSIIID